VLLAFGLGLLFAAVSSIIPDMRAVVKILFLPLYFISGILFPVTRFPDSWVQWMAINPVLHSSSGRAWRVSVSISRCHI
jgi:capsular polysaccharide transport system permease protein